MKKWEKLLVFKKNSAKKRRSDSQKISKNSTKDDEKFERESSGN